MPQQTLSPISPSIQRRKLSKSSTSSESANMSDTHHNTMSPLSASTNTHSSHTFKPSSQKKMQQKQDTNKDSSTSADYPISKSQITSSGALRSRKVSVQESIQCDPDMIHDAILHSPHHQQTPRSTTSKTIERCREKLGKLDRLTKIMSDKRDMSVIKGILIMENDMTPEAVETMLRERMINKFLRFRSRLEHGSFIELMPHELNLKKHIHHIYLPIHENSEEDLRLTLSQYVNKPLDPKAPLWEAYMVHNYEEGFVMMLRVHHSIGDGAALAMVFNEFCDQDIEFPDCQPPKMTPMQYFGFMVAFFFLQIVNLMRVVWKSLYMFLGAADPESPIKIPVKSMAQQKQISWTKSFDLELTKQIGRPYNATINDVMLCVIAGALDRFRREKCIENDEFCNLTECDIRCIHPVNTRTSPVIKNPDNDAAFLFALLPLGIMDPQQRLVEIKSRMDHLKAINEKFYAKFLINLLNFLPGKLLKPAMDWMTSKVSVVVSNVRGPAYSLSINGNPIKDCIGFLPSMHGIGISICIFSFNGHLRVGLTTNDNLTKNPKKDLIRFLEEEWQHMANELLPATSLAQVVKERAAQEDAARNTTATA